MATRTLNRLNASMVAVAKGPAKPVGRVTALAIDKNHNRRWVFCMRAMGRRASYRWPISRTHYPTRGRSRDAMNTSLARESCSFNAE